VIELNFHPSRFVQLLTGVQVIALSPTKASLLLLMSLLTLAEQTGISLVD